MLDIAINNGHNYKRGRRHPDKALIYFDEQRILWGACGYFPSSFSDIFIRNFIENIWKIFINTLKKEQLIARILATFECSYSVFP